jgi:hypothetical protein
MILGCLKQNKNKIVLYHFFYGFASPKGFFFKIFDFSWNFLDFERNMVYYEKCFITLTLR